MDLEAAIAARDDQDDSALVVAAEADVDRLEHMDPEWGSGNRLAQLLSQRRRLVARRSLQRSQLSCRTRPGIGCPSQLMDSQLSPSDHQIQVSALQRLAELFPFSCRRLGRRSRSRSRRDYSLSECLRRLAPCPCSTLDRECSTNCQGRHQLGWQEVERQVRLDSLVV